MVSDTELVDRLREILGRSDLDKATAGSVRRQLEEEFGVDFSDRKGFIREQIDAYLQSMENAEEEAEEEEEDGEGVKEDGKESESKGTSGNASREKKRRGGFNKLCNLSPQLQDFVREPVLARTEVVKKMWSYIREKNLQDPTDKRKILCDENLQNLFSVDSIDMFQMNKALAKHIWPLDESIPQKIKSEERTGSASEEDVSTTGKEAVVVEDEDEGGTEKGEGENEDGEGVKEDGKESESKGTSGNASREKKRRGGFNKLCNLSPQLQDFVGEPVLARTEVVKKMWSYIREKNLQDPTDKRKILCDENLQNLFSVDSIDMFQMNKALAKHIGPLDESIPQKIKSEERTGSASEEDVSTTGKEAVVVEDEDEGGTEKGEGRKKRSIKNGKDVKKRGGGFYKPCSLSLQLQAVVGEAELARPDVVKKLWAYIREKNLQDPSNKQNIICDELLRPLFSVDLINMFKMNKALSKHIWPLNGHASNNSLKEEKSKRVRDESDEDETEQKDKIPKKGGGLTAPLPLSEALMKFLGTGESELSHDDVVKRMWEYIKEHGLQDPSDKRRIICDDKLRELFEVDSFQGFSVSKLLTSHFIKVSN